MYFLNSQQRQEHIITNSDKVLSVVQHNTTVSAANFNYFLCKIASDFFFSLV